MVEKYHLNLGRGLTTPVAVRRKYYFWMLGYLLFAGAVFSEGVVQIALRIKAQRAASAEIAALRSRWAEQGGTSGPQAYLEELTGTAKRQSGQLTAIGKQMKDSIPFLPVLFEVQSTLPDGVEYTAVSMNPKSFTIALQFAVDGETSPEDYLFEWRQNAILNKYLEPLQVVNRTSSSRGEGNAVKMICDAKVK